MESGRLAADVLYVGQVIDWDPSMQTSWWFDLCRRKLDEERRCMEGLYVVKKLYALKI